MMYRATTFCMWLYLVGAYRESSNDSPRVKTGLAPGSQVLHGLIQRKLPGLCDEILGLINFAFNFIHPQRSEVLHWHIY